MNCLFTETSLNFVLIPRNMYEIDIPPRVNWYNTSKPQSSKEDDIVKQNPDAFNLKYRCVVPNCTSSYYQILDKQLGYENIRFTQFPRNLERRMEWLESIRKGTGLEISLDNSCHARVCIKHFHRRYFTFCGRLNNAVPTLFSLELANLEQKPDYDKINSFHSNDQKCANCVDANLKTSYDLFEHCSVGKNTIAVDGSSNTNCSGEQYNSLKLHNANEILQLLGGKLHKDVSGDEYYILEVGESLNSEDLPMNDHQELISILEGTNGLVAENDWKEPMDFSQSIVNCSILLDHNYCRLRLKSLDISIPDSSEPKRVFPIIDFPLSPFIEEDGISERIIKYRNLKKKRHRQLVKRLKNKIKFKLLEKKFGKIHYWSVKDNLIECQVGYNKEKISVLCRKDIFSLANMGTNPSSHRELKNSYIMPYGITLKTWLRNLPFKSGINSFVLTRLAKKVKRKVLLCALLFGTVHLSRHSQNYSVDDKNRHKKMSHALVFMVMSIRKNWKQPVAYYLVENLSVGFVSDAITEVVTNLQKIKYCVVGTVCNYTRLNRKALAILCQKNKINCTQPYFSINNQNIFTIYDPSSLLVATRSALLNYDIEYEPQKLAKFSSLIDSLNCHKNRKCSKLTPKIKDLLLKDSARNSKLKVAQLTFSDAVVSCIGNQMQGQNTAEFLFKINKMFKNFNKKKKQLYHRSRQQFEWKKMVQFISKWSFHSKIKGYNKNYLSFKNAWITTITATEKLCRIFKTEPLNLYPLQNFFTSAYYLGTRNRKFSAHNFTLGYKLSLLNNLNVPRYSKTNFRRDEARILDNYQDIFKSLVKSSPKSKSMEFDTFSKLVQHRTSEMGKFLLKNLKLGDCKLCSSSVLIDSSLFDCIRKDDKQITFLVTKGFSMFISNIYHTAMCILERFGYFQEIQSKLKLYLMKNINFEWFDCPEHKEFVNSALLDLSIALLIKKHLKT